MLQNIWQHPKTSFAGLLVAVVTVAGVLLQQGITLGNLGTGTVVSLIAALATALLGLLAKDPTSSQAPASQTTTKLSVLFLIVALLAARGVFAQSTITTPAASTTQTGITFSGSSEATALHFGGQWGAATHVTESLDFLDWGANKTNSLSIEGHELVAGPSAGWNAYMGGLRLTPDISSLFKKTNIPAGSLGIYFQGAGGIVNYPTANHVSLMFGGGFQYKLTSSLTWSTVHAAWGKVGAQQYEEVSTGLEYFFVHQ